MLIECTLKRPGGTTVDLNGKSIVFAPSEKDGRHVADVTDQADVDKLLAIPEAYRRADGKASPKQTVAGSTSATPASQTDQESRKDVEDADELDTLNKTDLVDIVKAEKVDVETALPKQALIDAIRAKRKAVAG